MDWYVGGIILDTKGHDARTVLDAVSLLGFFCFAGQNFDITASSYLMLQRATVVCTLMRDLIFERSLLLLYMTCTTSCI
jgi:hypothetical protein